MAKGYEVILMLDDIQINEKRGFKTRNGAVEEARLLQPVIEQFNNVLSKVFGSTEEYSLGVDFYEYKRR